MIADVAHLWIGGRWRSPRVDERLEIIGAATERPVGRVAVAQAEDVDAAVRAARAAFEGPGAWSRLPGHERAAILRRFARALADRAGEIVTRVSTQNGMPVSVAGASEGVVGPRLLDYYAGLVADAPEERERERLGGGVTVVRQEPLGVVACVVPWNFPVSLAFFKIAPALAAGCTVVWKPSPETVLDALTVIEASDVAGLPPGVLNVVPGGRDVGETLVAHPGIDKVAFTGSTAAGRAIAETCGRLLRPVTLELGGKSAAVVLEDADLTDRAADLFNACLLNNGQTCYLSSRVLAPRSRYDEVVTLFADLVSSATVGDPLDPATTIGPVATSAQRDRVEGFIKGAGEDGARLVAGGGRPTHLTRGWFVAPTVFADVSPWSRLATEEVFGPVLAITAYTDVDDAVRLANDSAYGLAGTVWTADEERGMAVARRVQTGSFGINGFRLDAGAPFGGTKASGLGRELGPEGLAAYQTTKTIYRTFTPAS